MTQEEGEGKEGKRPYPAFFPSHVRTVSVFSYSSSRQYFDISGALNARQNSVGQAAPSALEE